MVPIRSRVRPLATSPAPTHTHAAGTEGRWSRFRSGFSKINLFEPSTGSNWATGKISGPETIIPEFFRSELCKNFTQNIFLNIVIGVEYLNEKKGKIGCGNIGFVVFELNSFEEGSK